MASTATAAAALFMELRQRSQSGLLIIRELIPESWPVDITVMPSSIEIKMGEDCKVLSFPPEVTVVPPSCRGLQYVPGDGLHMRLLFQADLNTKSLPAVGESLKPKKRCTFYCQSCGESIISNQTFLRVLPLPSEDWNDLVDEWCCHPNPFNNSILQPQNGDCFLGPNYFLVNSGTESACSGLEILNTDLQGAASKSSDSALNSKANSRVICKRCKTLLGEIMLSGATKYYFTELLIHPSEESFTLTPRSAHIQRTLAHSLIELSSARSTFRFSIQGTNGATFILIWLLNSDTFLVESSGNMASSHVFTLLEFGMSSNSRPSEIWKAVKLLYRPCIKSRNKELIDAWGNDAGVCTLTFPSHTCLEMLLILSQSNVSLPPSLRWMNSFQVKSFRFGFEGKSCRAPPSEA